MSATLDADLFARYLGPGTPVVRMQGRTFPVSSLYLEEILEMTKYRSPAGGGGGGGGGSCGGGSDAAAVVGAVAAVAHAPP